MAVGSLLGGSIFDITGGYQIAFAVGLAFNFGNLLMVFPLTRRYIRSLAPQPSLA